MAKITFADVSKEVSSIVPNTILRELCSYISEKNLSLWGLKKTKTFEKRCLIIAIFKHQKNIGYCKLSSITKDWLKLTDCSIRHNTQLIIHHLGEWGQSKINLGSAKTWNDIAKQIQKPSSLSKTNLLMDSVDFSLWGKRNMNTKNDLWSYKLNGPGKRFQVVMDLQTRIVALWGGYSPKIYDGNWLESHKS